MAASLSDLVHSLTEIIHKIKCKDCHCFFEYQSVKEQSIKCKCLSCNKDYSNNIDVELKNRFKNTFKFSNNNINKFILLLKKGISPYEYMDNRQKFNETSLPENKGFYSNLNLEDIADADYMHVKRICKDFEIKNSGEHHDLYLKMIHYFQLLVLKILEKCF